MNAHASPTTIDVGELLDNGPWTLMQKTVLAIVSIAFIVDGIANQVLSVSIPALIKEWHVARGAFAPITAISLAGVTLGTVCGGMIGDRIGRKTALTFSVLAFGLCTCAIAFIHDLSMLAPLRFISGVGIGGAIPNATALIAEFTPRRRRSRAVNIGLISIPIGILLCGLIGATILPSLGWRDLFLFDGALSVVLAGSLLAWLPESPRYLLLRPKRRPELCKGLKRLGLEFPADAKLVDGESLRVKGPLSTLFGRSFIQNTIGLWGSFFFCFLAVYTVLNWIPTLLSSRGFPLAVTSTSLSAWSVGGIAGSLLGAWLIERFGSKPTLLTLMLAGAVGAVGLSALPLRPQDGVWPVMLSLAGEGVCLSGLTGCLYALAAHIYPPSVKSTGVGAAGAIGRSGAIVSSFAAVAVMGFGGGRIFFLFAAGATLTSAIFLLLVNQHIPKEGVIERGAAYR